MILQNTFSDEKKKGEKKKSLHLFYSKQDHIYMKEKREKAHSLLLKEKGEGNSSLNWGSEQGLCHREKRKERGKFLLYSHRGEEKGKGRKKLSLIPNKGISKTGGRREEGKRRKSAIFPNAQHELGKKKGERRRSLFHLSFEGGSEQTQQRRGGGGEGGGVSLSSTSSDEREKRKGGS